MFAKPQAEHQWLEQLVGDWEFEHNCTMPDGTTNTAPGRMHCRTLSGMWLISEGTGETEDGGHWTSIMTVGFDVEKKKYVGTFIGSMMSNIWPYEGIVDETGKRLPLYSEGPKFDGSGIGKYRDTIEIIDQNTWNFSSEMLTDNGEWVKFMDGLHVRK